MWVMYCHSLTSLVTLGKAVLRETVGGAWRWVTVDATGKGLPGEAKSRGQGPGVGGSLWKWKGQWPEHGH